MHYSYPSFRIQEIVKAPKCLAEGERFTLEFKGERGRKFDVNLVLLDDGLYSDPRFLGHTHDVAIPETYAASLLLGGHKVRGPRPPRGRAAALVQAAHSIWMAPDIINPNLATTDDNNYHRREPLGAFAPTDLQDFISKTAELWNIDLGIEPSML